MNNSAVTLNQAYVKNLYDNIKSDIMSILNSTATCSNYSYPGPIGNLI